MSTAKELLQDVFEYFSKKDMYCEFKNGNALLVRFKDERFENLEYIPIHIVIDEKSLRWDFYCFNVYKITEDKKTIATILLNTINGADVVFSKYSIDDDNEIKALVSTLIIPEADESSVLIPGFIATMAKDIDNIYPLLKNTFN